MSMTVHMATNAAIMAANTSSHCSGEMNAATAQMILLLLVLTFVVGPVVWVCVGKWWDRHNCYFDPVGWATAGAVIAMVLTLLTALVNVAFF